MIDTWGRRLLAALALTLAVTACGGDDDPVADATPAHTEAIGTLIDADLTADEQRCILEELVATGIDPQAILDDTITGDEDAELLAIAIACVGDLADVPAFVQSVIDASAEAGTPLTEDEARCVIDRMAEDDAAGAAECTGTEPVQGDSTGPVDDYGDDPTLDLLWDACENGNNQACDDLYLDAPLGSAYLEFARTCGGRLPDSVGLRCFLDLD